MPYTISILGRFLAFAQLMDNLPPLNVDVFYWQSLLCEVLSEINEEVNSLPQNKIS